MKLKKSIKKGIDKRKSAKKILSNTIKECQNKPNLVDKKWDNIKEDPKIDESNDEKKYNDDIFE